MKRGKIEKGNLQIKTVTSLRGANCLNPGCDKLFFFKNYGPVRKFADWIFDIKELLLNFSRHDNDIVVILRQTNSLII